jgi:hypothetical protein
MVYSRVKGLYRSKPPVVAAGSAAGFLAVPAAVKAGFGDVLRIEDFLGGVSSAAPALAVAVLAGRGLERQ